MPGSWPRSAGLRWNTHPGCQIPYVSKVDAGTLEVVRGCGVDLASSGDLIQQFEATWDDDQWQMHREAEKCTTSAYDLAWGLIAERIRAGGTIRETEVQAAIMDHFHRHGMTTYSPPIVGVGPHSGDPHYEPVAGKDGVIGAGEFVLIDLWCKLDKPRAVYSDLTRVGFTGKTVPETLRAHLRHRRPGPRRRSRVRPCRLRRRPAPARLGSGRRLPQGDRRRRLR